jgi:predicted outer membrane repeat protein
MKIKNKMIRFIAIALMLGNYWAANAAGTVRLVTNTNDSGDGSLRAAITALAGTGTATGAVDTIRFDPNLKGDTIVLATYLSINSRNVVIDGENNHIVISGNNQVYLFSVGGNTYVFEMSNLTLTAGYNTGPGGAMRFSGQRSGGTYKLNNVRFEDNTNAAYYAAGGAIGVSSNLHLVIDHCTFTGNTLQSTVALLATATGGGAIYSTSTGIIEISNSLFENNSSDTQGGAILGENFTVTGCVFKNNSAKGGGGAVALYRNNAGTNIPSAKFLGNTFIGNSTESATENDVIYTGGVFDTNQTAGSALFAANVFQDNTAANDAANNEFYRLNETATVTSNGYNVFKGASVPATGTDTWTNNATDLADAGDIVNAGNGRISAASPAFQIIETSDALIEGLAFSETDLFGNTSGLPYNAGADQGAGVVTLEDITADQPVYQNGEEQHIGIALVDAPALLFENIGFSVPAGLAFTESSYTLKKNTAFTLTGISIGDGDNGTATRLQLTVNFAPAAEQEYTDTLVISASGANDFEIPLRGEGISWTVSPEALQDFGRIAVGNTSEVQTVTITGSSASGLFSYSLKNGQDERFPVSGAEDYSAKTGGDLEIRFAPATAGAISKDTLVIVSADSNRSYEIALSGSALPVAAALSLPFGDVVVSADRTLSLPVTIASGYGVSVTGYTSSDPAFSVAPDDNWSAIEGGDLLVTFTPGEARTYSATLTLSSEGSGFTSITVALEGTGLARPVVSSEPTSISFGEVVVGESEEETVIVTLANPQSQLTGEGVFSLAVGNGTFAVTSITEEAAVATVVLAFTPSAVGEYLDTLIVQADYAAEYRIPLIGTGYTPVVSSDPLAVSFGEVAVGASKSETVTVTLTDPAVPLTASAFSLAAGNFTVVSVTPTAAATAEADVVEVTLSFTPSAVGEYLDTLIVQADYAAEYRIPLIGTGYTPVVSSDPLAVSFGEVTVGASKSETVTVTLTDPAAPLTASAFSLAAGNFTVVSVTPTAAATAEADVVEVTLLFTPSAVGEYLDTLIVQADYAAEYRIPLSGTGINDDVAIQNVKTATPQVSVRNGNIVVSRIAASNRISVYNLHGQLVKMQTATSDAEILKTASFPHGAYIVVIKDKQEILKRKVVL